MEGSVNIGDLKFQTSKQGTFRTERAARNTFNYNIDLLTGQTGNSFSNNLTATSLRKFTIRRLIASANLTNSAGLALPLSFIRFSITTLSANGWERFEPHQVTAFNQWGKNNVFWFRSTQGYIDVDVNLKVLPNFSIAFTLAIFPVAAIAASDNIDMSFQIEWE